MEDNARGQQILQRAMQLRGQSEEIEKQLDFISEQIAELQNFNSNLEILKESKEKEMIANIGKGVHMKVLRAEEEKLFVEVGAGIFVRKTPSETQEAVLKQIAKFQEAKIHLTSQLHEHAEEFRVMLKEIEGLK